MKRTLGFYKKYLPFVFLNIVFLFAQAMCELALPGYMSNIIDKGIIPGDIAYIYKTGIAMLGVTAISITFAICAGFFASNTASRACRNMRQTLFEKITSFSEKEFTQFQSASLITRSTNDIQTIQQTSIMVMRMAFFAPAMGIGAMINALRTSPSLSWTIGLSLLCVLFIMAIMLKVVMPKFSILQKMIDRINLIINERLSGILVVRAFNSEKKEELRFTKANGDLTNLGIFVNKAMSFMFPSLTIVMNLTNILIVWVGAHMIDAGNLEIGSMLAFIQYATHVITSFLVITVMFIMIPRAIVSMKRINEVLEVEPSISDSDTPQIPSKVTGHIKFDNVSFSYAAAEEMILEGISFEAKPGETTAIIGSTGSGKSSLINLVPRFYDVTKGSITLDGIDIRNIPQKELRDHIGIVPQKGLLFSGTVKSNLLFGKEDATDQELEEALKTAQAYDFVMDMPQQLETPVAQGGTSVSGGQKQRLSIARAIVRKPEILIFDDSFSALDFETDKKLRNALKDTVGNSTFIIVAQRINTILNADQIIVLDEGKIVGKGTHQELLADNKVYQEIAYSQLNEDELSKGGALNG